MNASRKTILLPVQFTATPALRLTITAALIRRHGVAPLLRKSVPAQMAARAAQAQNSSR